MLTTRRGLARQKPVVAAEPEEENEANDLGEYASSLFNFKTQAPKVKTVLADLSVDEGDAGSSKEKARRCGDGGEKLEPYIAQSIEIPDDHPDDDTLDISEHSELNSSQVLPPTPPEFDVPVSKKPRRMKRELKSAISKLTKIRSRLEKDEVERDVSVIESSPGEGTADERGSTMSVKVRTPSGLLRFPMLPTDPFASVMRLIAQQQGVDEDLLFMFVNDTTIHSYDSPASVTLGVADIIDCHVRNPAEKERSWHECTSLLEGDPQAMALRIQDNGHLPRLTVWVKKHEPLERAMRVFARYRNQTIEQLEFQFDGETVQPGDTAESLDLEDGFCIDVVPACRQKPPTQDTVITLV